MKEDALKLRFWPEHEPEDDNGELLDLDWSWIKALRGLHVGELRIHDTIGGCDNLRVIFFDPPGNNTAIADALDPVGGPEKTRRFHNVADRQLQDAEAVGD